MLAMKILNKQIIEDECFSFNIKPYFLRLMKHLRVTATKLR